MGFLTRLLGLGRNNKNSKKNPVALVPPITRPVEHIIPTLDQKERRDQSEKVIVDLSVPHNVDDDVLESYNINYIDIETLRNLAETNMNLRRTELTKAQSYVQDKLQAFNKAIIDRQIEKMLQFLPSQIQDIKKQAVDEVYRHRLDQLDPQSKALVIEMMDYMAKKCVAAPMKLARES